jgi:hypothetical protein
MKKSFKKLSLVLITAILSLGVYAVTDKLFTVKGEGEDWNNVLFVISQSNAPHLQVIAAHEFIAVQLKSQVDSTGKPKN